MGGLEQSCINERRRLWRIIVQAAIDTGLSEVDTRWSDDALALFRPKLQQSRWPTKIDLLAIRPAHCSAYVRLHCLVNGLPYYATAYLVRQQVGPWVNVRDSRMTPAPSVGAVHRVAEGCQRTLAAAAPGPVRYQLTNHAPR
jgi:hypothetical protein